MAIARTAAAHDRLKGSAGHVGAVSQERRRKDMYDRCVWPAGGPVDHIGPENPDLLATSLVLLQ